MVSFVSVDLSQLSEVFQKAAVQDGILFGGHWTLFSLHDAVGDFDAEAMAKFIFGNRPILKEVLVGLTVLGWETGDFLPDEGSFGAAILPIHRQINFDYFYFFGPLVNRSFGADRDNFPLILQLPNFLFGSRQLLPERVDERTMALAGGPTPAAQSPCDFLGLGRLLPFGDLHEFFQPAILGEGLQRLEFFLELLVFMGEFLETSAQLG